MTQNSLQFTSSLAVVFEDIPPHVSHYLQTEFSDGWHRGTSTHPLVIVRFKTIRPVTPIRFIGARACTNHDRFFLRDPHGALLEINFSEFDQPLPLHVTAEPTISVRFLLQALEHFCRALAPKKNCLFIHASGFALDDRAVLIPAWAHTGKTNTLLSFLKAGAEYYGDDWCIVAGGQLFAYPKRLNLFGYNFRQFPELRARLPWRTKILFRLIGAVAAPLKALARHHGAMGHYAHVFANLFENQGHVRVGLTRLFPSVVVGQPRPLRYVVLPQRTNETIALIPLPVTDLVNRLLPCLEHERDQLQEWYRMYRFAFPDRRSAYLDGLSATEATVLKRQFDQAATYFLSLGDGTDTGTVERVIRSRLV